MARLLIQSLTTGMFLIPDPEDGQPVWVGHLREAGGGVVSDLDEALQLVAEWCDPEDRPSLVDLDRLGTANDYPLTGAGGAPHGTAAGPGLGGSEGGPGFHPDGNHGDIKFSEAHHA